MPLDACARVEVRSRDEWRRWLERHHAQADPIWLVTWKKGGEHHLPYADVVEEALCFGWIDSLPRKLDTRRTMLLLGPRKPGSSWSAANRERAERLAREGLMTPAGRAKMDAAKADGSWDRRKAAETGAAPDDLAAALREAGATPGWTAFSLATRTRIVAHVGAAKRPDTRAKRIASVVEGARTGLDPLDWRRSKGRGR